VTKRLDHYRLSRHEIARHRCNDCGVNVIEKGDYCMLRSDIWKDQFGLGWNDNLCLACIEKRLGRKLTMLDLISFTYIEGHPMSATLLSRLPPPTLRKNRHKARRS
jgi:hypothetical protein